MLFPNSISCLEKTDPPCLCPVLSPVFILDSALTLSVFHFDLEINASVFSSSQTMCGKSHLVISELSQVCVCVCLFVCEE